MMGNLPIWMDGPNARAFKSLMTNWWEQVGLWARLPVTTFDVLTCDIRFVDLIAYQRGIDRYAGELEGFYRLRVHHAWRNAIAAGTPAGMTQVFDNLALPVPEFTERLPQYDWDMTKVRIPSRDYADATLREQIHFTLSVYWQTCRRFVVVQRTNMDGAIYGANTLTQRAHLERTINPDMISARPANNMSDMGNAASHRAHQYRTASPAPIKAGQSSNGTVVGNTAAARHHTYRQLSPSYPSARPLRNTLVSDGVLSMRSHQHRQLTAIAPTRLRAQGEIGEYFKAGSTFTQRCNVQRQLIPSAPTAVHALGEMIYYRVGNSLGVRQRTIRSFA